MHEPLTNIRKVIALIVDRNMPTTEVWRALYGAAVLHRAAGKYVIAVNDDIDPDNADASSGRCPTAPIRRSTCRSCSIATRATGPAASATTGEDASVLIDATLKENFPPISLPKREYMERAKAIWEELGLPTLKPRGALVRLFAGRMVATSSTQPPRAATRGDYFETGEAAGESAAARMSA